MARPPQRGDEARPPAALVVMCGPLAGLSGGDVHALRLVQRWERRTPGAALLLAPELMRPQLPEGVDPRMRPVRTPLDPLLRGLVTYALIVVLRTLAASFRAPPARVTVASSHFFHDVIPCVVHRRRHGSRPVAYVYHLVREMDRPPGLRSQLSLAGESLSLALIRRAGALVFVDNPQTRAALVAAGIPADLVVDTQNAYDPPAAIPARSPAAMPHVLFTGRFTAEKGIWDMLVLARALAAEVPESRITMMGDGPLRAELLQTARGEGLRNLDAPGFVSDDEKWRLLRSATLFAAPSREEGWGIAVGEALIAELPAVVYDLPAYQHLDDLVLRVPTGDVDRFVATVTGLLRDRVELDALQRHVAANADRLPRWNEILDREIDRMEELTRERG